MRTILPVIAAILFSGSAIAAPAQSTPFKICEGEYESTWPQETPSPSYRGADFFPLKVGTYWKMKSILNPVAILDVDEASRYQTTYPIYKIKESARIDGAICSGVAEPDGTIQYYTLTTKGIEHKGYKLPGKKISKFPKGEIVLPANITRGSKWKSNNSKAQYELFDLATYEGREFISIKKTTNLFSNDLQALFPDVTGIRNEQFSVYEKGIGLVYSWGKIERDYAYGERQKVFCFVNAILNSNGHNKNFDRGNPINTGEN